MGADVVAVAVVVHYGIGAILVDLIDVVVVDFLVDVGVVDYLVVVVVVVVYLVVVVVVVNFLSAICFHSVPLL